MTPAALDVRALYDRFFELGGPPPRHQDRPWAYRRRSTSLRLPGCLLVADLVRTRKPARVLDLGSGLTSVLLRSLAKHEAPDMCVVTTDLSPHWLAVTVKELIRDGLDYGRCYIQPDFEALTLEPFDLITVDIGDTAYRYGSAEKIAGWVAPGGVIVLDDWHLHTYPDRMGEALARLGFDVTVHHGTLDQFGGKVATAERPAGRLDLMATEHRP